MNIKFLKKIKQINRKFNKNVKSVTNANLIVTDNTIELETNGMLSVMIIQYTGVVFFTKEFNFLTKLKVSKNTILITNLFKNQIQGRILTYSGNLKIKSCKIYNFDQTHIIPSITNSQEQNNISSSKTKFEDSDELLYDIKRKSKRYKTTRGSRSYSINNIEANRILGKKYTKQDIKTIANDVAKALQRADLIINPKNIAKITSNIPQKTLTEPTKEVVKPLTEIVKPSTTSVKNLVPPATIEEKTGGKY